MTPEQLAQKIEALLFSEGGTLSRKKISSLLGCKESELEAGFAALRSRLQGGGLALITTDTEATLAVAPEATETVQKAFLREIGREIGDAGLEVLAIILYRGPSTRAQVDYIRGVNTSSTLRNLLSRGLIERVGNPDDAREYLYRPTAELLAHLGVGTSAELPDHATIVAELQAFESTQTEKHGTE